MESIYINIKAPMNSSKILSMRCPDDIHLILFLGITLQKEFCKQFSGSN